MRPAHIAASAHVWIARFIALLALTLLGSGSSPTLVAAADEPETLAGAEAPDSFFDDGDGVPWSTDNCPYVRNRDQADADGDGCGDRCECGDASGDGLVNTTDARLVQRCTVGDFAPNACPFPLCDVTGDGRCNTSDARVIQRVATGRIDKRDLSCAQRQAPTAALYLADSDADGISDADEIVGWTIQVDELGLGTNVVPNLLTVIDVQSANLGGDTDSDGLDDLTEFLIRSHPGKPDTDGDGLSDAAEWNQWLSSPVSVDTDGDARGPSGDLAPNPSLFDGLELDRSVAFYTSPTLHDTDGDGKTDYEEIDNPIRSPLVSDLPQYEVTFVEDADVRLFVEYQEGLGQETQYGTSMSTSETTTTTRGGSDTTSFDQGLSVMVGAEYKFPGGGAKVEVTGSWNWGEEHTSSWEESSSETAQSEYSEYQSDTLTKTEIAARGSISVGLEIENKGISTFEIGTLGLSVLQYSGNPVDANFKTVGTLLPDVQGITLAPGETSPVLRVGADDVNPALIKQFLANPTSLHYETVALELLDSSGINFDFLLEQTLPQTALVIIDFGDGRVERYRVATNVDRGSDSSFLGVPMSTVLTDQLGIPYETSDALVPGNNVLKRVRASDTIEADGFVVKGWSVFVGASLDDPNEPLPADFNEIRLRARDEITLAYVKDEDQDGLVQFVEELFGSVDTPGTADTDGDGLTDAFEARDGWTVEATHREFGEQSLTVYSDPRTVDADGDGLTDCQEAGVCPALVLDDGTEVFVQTDPSNADTDGDALADGIEVARGLPPDEAAPRLYVDSACGTKRACGDGAPESPPEGESWDRAFSEVSWALKEARRREATPDKSDDATEIWVAQGIYTPPVGICEDPTECEFGPDRCDDNGDCFPNLCENIARRCELNRSRACSGDEHCDNSCSSSFLGFCRLTGGLCGAIGGLCPFPSLCDAQPSGFCSVSNGLCINDSECPANTCGQFQDPRCVVSESPCTTDEECELDRTASFELISLVGLYGGFVGGETKRDQRSSSPFFNNTTLSGDLNEDDGVNFIRYEENSFHVVRSPAGVEATAALDGFIVTGGNAVDPNTPEEGSCSRTDETCLETFDCDKNDCLPVFLWGECQWGGGVCVWDTDCPSNVCEFALDASEDDVGGGIVIQSSEPKLRNLQIRLNRAKAAGGGIFQRNSSASLEDSIVFRNRADLGSGGGVAVRVDAIVQAPGSDEFVPVETVLRDVALFDNESFRDGGGLEFVASSNLPSPAPLVLEQCLFEGNAAGFRPEGGEAQSGSAGGLQVRGPAAVDIRDSEFRQNSAVTRGGGILFEGENGARFLLAQSVVFGNTSSAGSGVSIGAVGEPGSGVEAHIIQSTFGNNTLQVQRSQELISVIDNTVLVSTDPPALDVPPEDESLVTIRNSCIEEDPLPARFNRRGNVSATGDIFVNRNVGDLHLDSGSTCVDIGSNLIDFDPLTPGFQPLPPGDLDGNPRISPQGGVVDAGAYEVQQ
jgi:hypothetical protein